MPRGKPKVASVRETAIDLANSIKVAFEQLVEAVESQPDAFKADDIAKIEGFVAYHNQEAGRRLRMLIARDVRGAGLFDFDMQLPAAPAVAVPSDDAFVAAAISAPRIVVPPLAALPAPAPSAPRLASAGGVVVPAASQPIGRMVGSKEIVIGEPEKPRPPEPQPSSDDFSEEPGFLAV